jgi:hypothetical protein
MLDGFFSLDDHTIALSFFLFYGFTGLLLYWLCHYSKIQHVVGTFKGIPPPFIVVPSSIFAFTSVFLGVAVWDNFRTNNESVLREGEAIVSYIDFVQSVPALNESGLVNAAKEYTRFATSEEWDAFSDKSKSSTLAQEAFKNLLTQSFEVANNPELKSPFGAALIQAAQKINHARNTRLQLMNTEPPDLGMRWFCVLALGILLQIVAAATNMEKPRLTALALSVATSAILLVLILIALSVDPYSGIVQVSKSPIVRILDRY